MLFRLLFSLLFKASAITMAVLHFLYKIEVFDCYLFAKSDRVKAGLHDRFFLNFFSILDRDE